MALPQRRAAGMHDPWRRYLRYSPECVERLYEKASNTGEPPRHEANHGSIYQRFAART